MPAGSSSWANREEALRAHLRRFSDEGPWEEREVIAAMMFGDGFEQSTILRTGPDGLTRVITRSSWSERESVLVEADAAELLVFRRWEEFHRQALGFMPSWESRDGD